MLDLLAELVAKSLVVMQEDGGEGRYGLLETVREYALERLRGAGEEAALRERHARYCLALAEEWEPVPWRADLAGAQRGGGMAHTSDRRPSRQWSPRPEEVS